MNVQSADASIPIDWGSEKYDPGELCMDSASMTSATHLDEQVELLMGARGRASPIVVGARQIACPVVVQPDGEALHELYSSSAISFSTSMTTSRP